MLVAEAARVDTFEIVHPGIKQKARVQLTATDADGLVSAAVDPECVAARDAYVASTLNKGKG